jgi:hypothetical protein
MATPDIGSGTAAGLLAFMDFMINKGYASSSSVSPWKSAAKQVFSTVEGDDYESLDVRGLDVEEYLGRFENRSIGKYKADSLAAYRSRFRRAVESYQSYLADPNWKPNLRATPRRSNGEGAKARTGRPASRPSPAPNPTPPSGGGSPSLITYPFPLKSGQMAQLHLPTTLDREDAERLTQFVRALVFEQPRQLKKGEHEDGEDA